MGQSVAVTDPDPLVAVAIPVADEYIEQTRGGVGSRVDSVVWAVSHPGDQRLAANDLGGAVPMGGGPVHPSDPFLEEAHHPAELRIKLAELRASGQHEEVFFRMRDSC